MIIKTEEAVHIARKLDSREATMGEKGRLVVWTTNRAVLAGLGSRRATYSIIQVSKREG